MDLSKFSKGSGSVPSAKVVQLPTRLVMEREAAALVVAWGVIRRDLQGTERATALLEWGFSMEAYIKKYGLGELSNACNKF